MADPNAAANRHFMILQQLRQGVPGGIYPDKMIPGGGPPMIPPQGGPTPQQPMPPAVPLDRQKRMADVIRTSTPVPPIPKPMYPTEPGTQKLIPSRPYKRPLPGGNPGRTGPDPD